MIEPAARFVPSTTRPNSRRWSDYRSSSLFLFYHPWTTRRKRTKRSSSISNAGSLLGVFEGKRGNGRGPGSAILIFWPAATRWADRLYRNWPKSHLPRFCCGHGTRPGPGQSQRGDPAHQCHSRVAVKFRDGRDHLNPCWRPTWSGRGHTPPPHHPYRRGRQGSRTSQLRPARPTIEKLRSSPTAHHRPRTGRIRKKDGVPSRFMTPGSRAST